MFALSWSVILFTNAWKHCQSTLLAQISDIVELQAYLLTAIYATGSAKRSSKAVSMVCFNNIVSLAIRYNGFFLILVEIFLELCTWK